MQLATSKADDGLLFPSERARLEGMAQEASISRLYGGLLYRADCEVGLRCGTIIGGFAVRRAQADGAY
jgi:hypothetical protein